MSQVAIPVRVLTRASASLDFVGEGATPMGARLPGWRDAWLWTLMPAIGLSRGVHPSR
jgi:hypothetical protein